MVPWEDGKGEEMVGVMEEATLGLVGVTMEGGQGMEVEEMWIWEVLRGAVRGVE